MILYQVFRPFNVAHHDIRLDVLHQTLLTLRNSMPCQLRQPVFMVTAGNEDIPPLYFEIDATYQCPLVYGTFLKDLANLMANVDIFGMRRVQQSPHQILKFQRDYRMVALSVSGTMTNVPDYISKHSTHCIPYTRMAFFIG